MNITNSNTGELEPQLAPQKYQLCLYDALWENPRWKFLCSYNQGVYITNGVRPHLPYDPLTTLMIVWLPMTFWLYMTLHILYMSFGLPIYNTFWIWIYINHKSDVAHGHSWHDMKWHLWHRLHDEMAMSGHYCYFFLCTFFRMLLCPPPYVLEIRSLHWYSILRSVCKLVSLCFILIDLLTYSAT